MKTIKAAILTAALSSIAFALPATAATVTSKKTCTQAVEDAKQSAASASVTAKTKGEINELIRVSEHLCTQANFVYAESLLAIARGMAAEE